MNKSHAPKQYQYTLNSNSRSISASRNSLRYWVIIALLALTTTSLVSCLRMQSDDTLDATQTLTSQDATVSAGGTENITQTVEATPTVTERNAATPNTAPTMVKSPEDAAGYTTRRQQSDKLVERAYRLLQDKFAGDEAVRLAREAVLTTLGTDGYVTRNARNVLQTALDTPTWQMTYPPAAQRHQAQTNSIDISPDGNILVTGGDNTVRLWHSTTLEPLHLFRGHEGSVLSTQFSSDGKEVLSTGTDHTIRLWDVETGIVTLLLNAHTDVVHAAHYSPDGKTIVSASDDGTVKVWDRVTGQELLTLPHSGPVLTAIYSPDGRMIASASAKQAINLWDARTGQLIQSLSVNDEVHTIAFAPDNKHTGTCSSVRSMVVSQFGRQKASRKYDY